MSPFGRRRAAAERRGTPIDVAVLGLGNPGAKYEGSRHNVGAEVVELLGERHDVRLRAVKHQPLTAAEAVIDGKRVVLARSTVYMNDSGLAARALLQRYGIDDPTKLVVVHDELDLPVGRLRVKAGGGLAGHNGLRSIQSHLHDDRFLRIRIGIGKPPSKEAGADHVLRQPSRRDREDLATSVEQAADAVEAIVADGVDVAMNRFN
jgi:PTH1 family peptidyl-tRNA hydrolase